MDKKRMKVLMIVTLILVVLVAATVVYLAFFLKTRCQDEICLKNSLINCDRAVYQSEENDATWLYEVNRKKEDKCEVKVKLLYLKQGTSNLETLTDKEMTCRIPLGTQLKPQDNLDYCQGLLKEEIQGLLIKKMHDYILKNLGKISEEFNKTV